jgi:hypothetical protein
MVAGCVQLGVVQPGTPQAPEMLSVTLTEGRIDVRPRMVARGKVGLELINGGELEHSFHIVVPGVD